MKTASLLILIALGLSACGPAPGAATPLPVTPEAGATLPTPSPSTPTPAPTAEFPHAQAGEPVFDLRYSDSPSEDPSLLSLDVYPTSAENAPVMIFVHGGGWYRGTKSDVDEKPQAFNSRGFTFVSINYRLYPDVTPAEQAGDVAAVIGWVKNHIGEYGGDPQRLFLLGHSAGAHLSSLVATDPTYLGAEGMALSDLRGVIALDSQAYDLPTLFENLPPKNGEVYRVVFGSDPTDWKKYSPITYVNKGKGIPPFFLAYTSEKQGRFELTQLFVQALEKADIPVTVESAVDLSHGQVNSQFGASGNHVSDSVFRWLAEILAGL